MVKDFISWLPDEVLLNILSKLNIKEQASTSVLSSRWTNLWTFSSCLNIDARDFIRRREDSLIKTQKFINTTDQILRMHRGPFIDQLKITCPDDYNVELGDIVDVWIEFAKQKQVKALHLDFKYRQYSSDKPRVKEISFGSTTFSSLVTLHLEKAFLSDSAVHDLLSRSPNILELSIINSGNFRRLNISGSSLKLKHLELLGNYAIFIDICAPTLVSFNFGTSLWPDSICFNNTPLLTKLSCPLGLILKDRCNFYSLLPQLATLTLTPSKYTFKRISSIPRKFPTLVNLKQMQVRLLSDNDNSRLLGLLPGLLGASPFLHSLILNLAPLKDNFFTEIDKFPDHAFLKVIEMNNFKGFLHEVDLLACIAESCSSLQKISIQSDLYKTKVEQTKVKSIVKKLVAQKELKIVFKAPNASGF